MKEKEWSDNITVTMYDELVSNSELYKEINNDIIEIAAINEGNCIVDVGCGTGITTIELVKRYNEITVFAIDPSQNMINCAKSKLKDDRVNYFITKGENINEIITKNSIDRIICNASFWQMDLDTFLSGAYQTIKPNGKLIFNLSRAFLEDIVPSQDRELGDYVIDIIYKNYGIKRNPINRITKKYLLHKIYSHGFVLEDEKMREYKRTIDEAYNFLKLPVMAKRITDKLTDGEWLDVLNLAYSQIDKTVRCAKWIYFVLKKVTI